MDAGEFTPQPLIQLFKDGIGTLAALSNWIEDKIQRYVKDRRRKKERKKENKREGKREGEEEGEREQQFFFFFYILYFVSSFILFIFS